MTAASRGSADKSGLSVNGAVDSSLLDLRFLTDAERERIRSVLEEDEKLRTAHRIKLGTLRQAVEKNRSHQKQMIGSRQCAICDRPFGSFMNTGAHCPVCIYRVCKQCRILPKQPPPKFMCTVCFDNGQLNLQFQEYSEEGLYGSELVKRSMLKSVHSLQVSSTPVFIGTNGTKKVVEEVPALEEKLKTPSPVPTKSHSPSPSDDDNHSKVSSQENSVVSSIVVTYTDDRSPSPVAFAQARRLAEGELSDSEGEEEKERDNNYLKRADSLNSFSSSLSLYSSAGGIRGDYDISGEVLLGIEYKNEQLSIHVNRARGLAAVDKNGTSHPYVKTYLLPDKSKHSKRKTKIKKKTVDPVYDQVLTYHVPASELESRTIWLTSWSYGRFGRNQFLGEVNLPLSSCDLSGLCEKWYSLLDRAEDLSDDFGHWELLLGLMYLPSQGHSKKSVTGGSLHVDIKSARQIAFSGAPQIKDAFVKCYLLPEKSHSSKRKTSVVKNSAHPTWDEEKVYGKVSLEKLTKDRVLEVTVWDFNRGSSNDFIGGLRLGSAPASFNKKYEFMDSMGTEVAHWEAMLSRSGQWVESWHTLRTNMDPRDVDFAGADSQTVSLPPPITEVEEEEGQEVSVHVSTLNSKLSLGRASILVQAEEENQKELAVHESAILLEAADAFIPNQVEEENQELAVHESAVLLEEADDFIPNQVEEENQDSILVQAEEENQELTVHKPAILLEVADAFIPNQNKTLSTSPSSGGEVQEAMLRFDGKEDTLDQDSVYEPVVAKTISPILQSERITQDNRHSETSSTLGKESTLQTHQVSTSSPAHPGTPAKRGLSASAAGSTISLGSSWSLSEGGPVYLKGDYVISGEVLLGVQYRNEVLSILVKQAKGLAAADRNGYSTPYVKTYLLPDKSKESKRKTSIKKKTLNPIYNETLKYKLPRSKLDQCTIWLTVWDYDRFSRNEFLGEINLPLSSIDLSMSSLRWYPLHDRVHSRTQSVSEITQSSEIEVSLMFIEKARRSLGSLHIKISHSRYLHNPKSRDTTAGFFVKCCLLPERSQLSRYKTSVVQGGTDPEWKEDIVFDKVKLENLAKERVLEITVWEVKHGLPDHLIGGLRLGPSPEYIAKRPEWMDSIGNEIEHWKDVLYQPGEWVSQWHTLRDSMAVRDIAV